jgi:hypothetical protein
MATLGVAATRLAGRRWLDSGAWQRWQADPTAAFELFERLLEPVFLVTVMVVVLTAALLFWLLNAVAEGGIIRAAAVLDGGGAATAGAIWREGLALVPPFVLIDTILFLPLFLLVLLTLLLGSGGLIALTLLLVQGSTQQTLLTVFLAGGACISGLLLLTVPLTLLTLIFRLIAFRCAALDGLRAMAAIRQAWHIIRHNAVHILFLMALVWVASLALNLLSGAPIGLLGMGSLLVGQAPEVVFSALSIFLFLAELVRALLHAILFVFTAALWTIAFQEFSRLREASPGRIQLATL